MSEPTEACIDRVIEDLPTGWRGVLHDLGVSLGLAQPTPGEKAAEAERRACCIGDKEAGQ